MALFQEQANVNIENEPIGKISKDFASELDSLYSARQKDIQQRQEAESQYVKNIVSPEKIQEWQNKGSMSAIEVWNKKNKNELVPFMGTIDEGTKSFKLKSVSDKLNQGLYVTPEERKMFEDFVLDMAEVQTRGYSFLGGVTNIGLETLPFALEFGAGLLTTGGVASFGASVARSGLKATAKEIGKTVAKEVAEEGLVKTIAKGAGKTLYNATLNPKTYAFTATRLPQQVRARMGDIMLSDSVAVTPEGQAILKEAEEKPATAFMKALALTNIEVASELSGETLVRPALEGLGKIIAPKVLRNMASKAFPEKFIKLAEDATKLPFFRAVDTLGWNGVLEEIGEERIGDLLKVTLNLDDEKGYSFEQFIDAMFPSMEQFGQEAVAFALTGVGLNAMHGGLKTISSKYSKDGFLADAGIFRIAGYDSLIDKRVKSILKEQGFTEDEIENAVDFSNRDDKIEFLKNNNITIEDDVKGVQEDFRNKLLADGVDEKNADFASRLYSQLLAIRADRRGENIEDLYAESDLKIKQSDNDEYWQELDAQYEQLAQEDYIPIKKVAITDVNDENIQINNSVWIPKIILRKEGIPYELMNKGYNFLLDQNRRNYKDIDFSNLQETTQENINIQEKTPFDANIEKIAKKHFGTTTNLNEAGYILNDGSLLDMSGKKFGGMAGRRSLDHREVVDAFIDSGNEKYEDIGFDEFIDNGAIRFMPEADSFLIARMPSESQFKKLKEIINKKNGEVSLELVTDMNNWGNSQTSFSKEYEQFSNPDKILDDVRTFYKGGKISEHKRYFQAESEKKITPVNIEKDSVPNFDKITDLKNWIYENLSLLGDIKIKSNNRTVQFSKGNISRSMKGISRSEVKRNSYAGLKELAENAIPSKPIPNDENHTKVKGQELYHSAFIYDGRVYGIEIKVDIPKNEKTPYTFAGHKIKMLSEVNGVRLDNQDTTDLTDSNISITDIRKLFNPTKYNQDKEPEQESIFKGNNKARNVRKIKGSYMPAEKLIEFFKEADESTIVHEFAHWYLDSLIEDAKYHEGSAEDLAEVRKFVKNTGGEFTREQHEKFARGFEAYIRSGRARSNRLKKIFEDFKNALMQIYDTITQIIYTEEGVEKPFTEEDLPQINALFERLLTTENERIQATVFDKVNEIEDKINDIKHNEQKEFDELDTIYRDNIEILNRKSDKKRKVQEYLDLAIGSARRETKEVKEWKKRYKEATLDILCAISGKSRSWVANSRNWEKLGDMIANADDKITTSGGLRAEWQDFYHDTGVSYENDEIDGDFKLGEMAFEVLTSGDFNPPYADEAYWKDVEYFSGQFDYLVKKIQSLKGEEQQVAYEALTTLVFDKSPEMPEEVYEDFINRFMKLSEEMEKNQKEDFNRKHYPNIPVVQQLQFYVTNKLNNLKIYNPNMRYKTRLDRSHGLYKSIKNATSVNDTKRIIKRINEYVIEDLRNGQRAILHKEIQKQLKISSRLVKVGSIKRGKFDWRTNTVFAELKELNKLPIEDAITKMNEILRINEIEAGEERIDLNDGSNDMSETMGTDFDENLKRKFLQYKSSRLKQLDVSHTTSLLEDILRLKEAGRKAKDAEEYKKRTAKRDYRNNLIQILNRHKDNKKAKFLTKWVVGSGTLINWETILNNVFDAETAKRYSLQRLEADVQVFARNKTLELINKANKIYGFKNNKWDKALDYDNMQKFIKLMQDYEKEEYNYSEVTWNKETREAINTPLKLSKSQIMTIYIWSLNDSLMQRLNNQYGVDQLKDMFSRLSEEDKQMCWEFVNVCESMYDDMNEVYIETYGISLPKVQNYFPSVTERVGSDLDMFHDFVVKSSNPSFIKTRKTCNKIPMKPKSPLEIILPHINKSANYIIMSEEVSFFNKIFKETPLNKKIVDVYGKKDGEKIIRAIQNQLSASTFTTVARGLNFAHEFADNLATNFISSSIAGSPKVMIGQLLSCINYSENMPVHKWATGFVKAISKPKETFEYMMSNCQYLQARLAGNTQNEMMSTLTSEVDRFRTIKNFCSLTTKWGDITAIIFGGKPYVDYLMSEGYTKQEAFDKFVDDTLRAQQAGLNSTTSEWQKAQTKTAFGRAFFAFNNTNLQYERKFVDALSKFSKGDIDNKDFAKSFIIYKILNPIMFISFLGNLSALELIRALTGGDDEPEEAIQKFGGDVLLAIMLGSLGAYGIAGLIAIQLINYGKALVDKKIFSGKPYVFDKKTPIISEIDMIGNKLLKNEITFADVVDITGSIGDIGTGLPVTRAFNALGGVGNIAEGEIGIGATRMLGWGEYKASEAWTGKTPKERKGKK